MDLRDRRERFRAVLNGDKCIRPASVYDPLSARVAQDIGYEIGMFAGSVASLTVLGAPDNITLTLSEFAGQARRICRGSGISLMCDADHGYGNALNVMRTVEELETAGVACLTIEDTLLPRRFGQQATEFIDIDEGVGKMKAALQARQDSDLVLLGRTGTVATLGLEAGIARAQAYLDAGVDGIMFVGVFLSFLAWIRGLKGPLAGSNPWRSPSPRRAAVACSPAGSSPRALPRGRRWPCSPRFPRGAERPQGR